MSIIYIKKLQKVKKVPYLYSCGNGLIIMHVFYFSGHFPAISDDLVNSYHLLLCCVDWFYANALIGSRKDLLNPGFTGQWTLPSIWTWVMNPGSWGARCSSVVRAFAHGAMGRRIPLSYFSFQLVFHDWCKRLWYVLYCLWDGAYKRTLAVNRKE